MIKEFKDISKNIIEEADVCVIGTGAGGAVAAKELAEKGLSVVALEEGSYFTYKNFNQDPGDMMAMMYRDSGTTVALGLPPASITMGKCIGGTTTINSATCFRTPQKVIKHWKREYDCLGLEYDTLVPYFEKVEKEISVTELSEDILGNAYQIVKRGAKELGLEAKPLKHNVKACDGAGVCQWGCIKGAKQSTEISYIPKADKLGARIYANCHVRRLDVESGKVRSVHGFFIDPVTGKRRYSITVKSKVVCLAMGSMITPAFLLKQRLANISGWVGKGLTIHPCGRVVAEMEEEVNGHHGVSQGGQIDAFEDEDIMLEGIFIPPGVMTMALPGIGEEHKYLAKHYNNLAAFGVMICDTTRGRIFPGLLGYSYIAWYSMNQTDTDKLQKGISIVADIFFAAGAKRVFTGCYGMPILTSRDDLKTFKAMKTKPWHYEVTAFHPLGTCRMGNDPRRSVVDLNLEAHDIKGLFITDGSPFPTSLGVNPQVTIMSFATRASDYIAENINRY
ncbi:MAG: GMC family oxidoreductase [Thermodesulfobacteriota bacterium]|nr:GMC family oxidoreductase [Thermodesulfobacteriota bacterium]